jgi:Fe2+ transport system protein B
MTGLQTFLLTAQTVILLGILIVLWVSAAHVRQLVERASSVLDEVQNTLEQEVRPTLAEARATLARAGSAATQAGSALNTAGPAIETVSRLAGVLQKNVSPLWLDAARVALRIYGVVRGKRRTQVPAKEITNAR